MSNSHSAHPDQTLTNHIEALRRQVEGLSAALGDLARSAVTTKDVTTAPSTAMANGAPTAAAKPAAFSAASAYRSLPRLLIDGDYYTHGGGAEDGSHMTLSELLATLRKARADATVSMGAGLWPKVLRVYPASHRVHTINVHAYVYCIEAVASLPADPDSEGTPGPFFNALQLGPQPTTVEMLIEDLEPYVRDAPDAIVLTPSGLASLALEEGAPQKVLCVLTRRQFDDFLESDLNPFDASPTGNTVVEEIVAKAKAQLAAWRPLADIATDLGRAFASGGLAAVDLFYVPAAKTRAAADLIDRNRQTRRGSLLTLAEFRRAHRRTITDAHIRAFYRPVTPADLSQPVSPLARVLSSDCTNIDDLYALLDDHEFFPRQ